MNVPPCFPICWTWFFATRPVPASFLVKFMALGRDLVAAISSQSLLHLERLLILHNNYLMITWKAWAFAIQSVRNPTGSPMVVMAISLTRHMWWSWGFRSVPRYVDAPHIAFSMFNISAVSLNLTKIYILYNFHQLMVPTAGPPKSVIISVLKSIFPSSPGLRGG